MLKIAVLTAGFLAAILIAPAQAEEPVCPEGTHAIYTGEGELVSCEEVIGPEVEGFSGSCLEGEEPGYLEDGTLAGCFGVGLTTEEVCAPTGEDADEDQLDDGCDPCLENPDCDGDGFCDGVEVYLATDPEAACPDDLTHPAWPLDINNDGTITVSGDVLNYRDRITATPGDPNWWQRLDLNGDGVITVSGDVLFYRNRIGTNCGEGPLMAGGWCWSCMDWGFVTESVRYHIHGEFNWTIHIPWLDDWVDTKYEMHMWATFFWISEVDIAGIGAISAWAEAEWPYTLWDNKTILVEPGGDLSMVHVEARQTIEFLQGVSTIPAAYAIWLSMTFHNGHVTGDQQGFHYWWLHEEEPL